MKRADKIELIKLLEERERRLKANRLQVIYNNYYVWQREFAAATAKYTECCLCAANQIGKTIVGTSIDAMHLTGDYPDDWPGHKFERAPMVWALGYSAEKTRDLIQTKLFGEYNPSTGFSGGYIPADRIVSHESSGGTANAMRTVRVKHSTGGTSVLQLWSYSQGQCAIMGDVVDWVHVDEEPRDQAIRGQLLTRTINGDQGRGGRLIYTFTPENGRTDLVVQFKDSPAPSQFYMQKGWKDAPHMTQAKRDRLLEQYPAHQRKMRSEGEPMLGHGRIYDIGDDIVECDPFEIPKFWQTLCGMDFGWDHPQALVKIVVDADNDIIYLTNSWKQSQASATDAMAATRIFSSNIPVAWPPDGLMHEKGRDVTAQQKDHYVKAGFKLTHEHATWAGGGNSVEEGIYEIIRRCREGRLKIFKGQPEFMEEFRQYHRDEHGKIVKVRDDMLDALRYALMMQRYAKVIDEIDGNNGQAFIMPTVRRPTGGCGVNMRLR